MQIAQPRYRANPDHSISVFGQFNDELASRLAGEILRLRKPPDDEKPITVFINSDGGDIRVLDIIDGALNCEDQNGKRVPVITVVVGNASSAAADLLVYGDYAIAYPHSSIYFHGVRYGEVRQITAERAGVTTETLRKTNLKISYALARSMIPRIVHRYAILRGNFKRRRKGITDKNLSELEYYVDAIKPKVSPVTFRKLNATLDHIQRARRLMFSVMPTVKNKQRPIKQDEQVLCALVRHEVKERGRDGWRLDEEGISTVVNDYLILRDYLIGDHRDAVRNILQQFGVEFLTDSEYKHFSKKKDRKKAEEFLRKKARLKLTLFWYFAVILCRNLLRDENQISPEDAYWIGAIDEVVGELHGLRLDKERVPDPPATESASSAPQPPASQSPPAG